MIQLFAYLIFKMKTKSYFNFNLFGHLDNSNVGFGFLPRKRERTERDILCLISTMLGIQLRNNVLSCMLVVCGQLQACWHLYAVFVVVVVHRHTVRIELTEQHQAEKCLLRWDYSA